MNAKRRGEPPPTPLAAAPFSGGRGRGIRGSLGVAALRAEPPVSPKLGVPRNNASVVNGGESNRRTRALARVVGNTEAVVAFASFVCGDGAAEEFAAPVTLPDDAEEAPPAADAALTVCSVDATGASGICETFVARSARPPVVLVASGTTSASSEVPGPFCVIPVSAVGWVIAGAVILCTSTAEILRGTPLRGVPTSGLLVVAVSRAAGTFTFGAAIVGAVAVGVLTSGVATVGALGVAVLACVVVVGGVCAGALGTAGAAADVGVVVGALTLGVLGADGSALVAGAVTGAVGFGTEEIPAARAESQNAPMPAALETRTQPTTARRRTPRRTRAAWFSHPFRHRNRRSTCVVPPHELLNYCVFNRRFGCFETPRNSL